MKQYIICKGDNFIPFFCRPKIFHFSDTLFFSFKLTSSCFYEFREKNGVLDMDVHEAINKIVGFSKGFNNIFSLFFLRYGIHKINSIRIGWRRTISENKPADTFDLFFYCYFNGEPCSYFIGTVKHDEILSGYIFFKRHNAGYHFYNKPWYFERKVRWSLGAGVMLYPYFGGTKPAPHNMEINLDFE